MKKIPDSTSNGMKITEKIFRFFNWKSLFTISLLLILGIWLACAGAVWAFVKYHQEYDEVHYADLAWPARWPNYQTGRGNFYINKGENLLRAGEYTAAMQFLSNGIAKSPQNVKGKLLLAQLYLAYRRPDLAKQLLTTGFENFKNDPEYLSYSFALLTEIQDDALLLKVATPLLTDKNNSSTLSPITAAFVASAYFNRGNYAEAEKIISDHLAPNSVDAVTLLARINWERGYPEIALLKLSEYLAAHPEQDGVRALQASYFRSLHRTTQWETAVVERMVADPFAYAPRIEYLYLQRQRGNTTRLSAETENYLQQFRANPQALLSLADFAANTGNPALARRVQQSLNTRSDTAGAASLMVAEAHIAAKEYQPALDLIASYSKDFPEWAVQYAPVFNGLQAVAYCGLGKSEEAKLCLDSLFNQPNLRADNLVAIANRLSALGSQDLALATLNRAVQADSLNESALNNLIRLELDTANLAALPNHVERLLATRKPSRELLSRSYTALGSDRNLFQNSQAPLLASLETALAGKRP